MNLPTPIKMLLLLMGFLGVGAIFGGAMFIISPSGRLFGMPLSMLSHSPFSNFFIPGTILFVVLGITPVVLVFALIKKPVSKLAERLNCCKDMYWAWTCCIYIAFALIIWLQTQMTFLRAVHWLQSFYMGCAIAIILLALLPKVRAFYKK